MCVSSGIALVSDRWFAAIPIEPDPELLFFFPKVFFIIFPIFPVFRVFRVHFSVEHDSKNISHNLS